MTKTNESGQNKKITKRGRCTKEVVKAKAVKMKELKEKGLTLSEIGAITGDEVSNISRILMRYGNTEDKVKLFKDNKSEILEAVQERILAAVTDQDIHKANLKDKLIGFAVAFDKHRIQTGQSTDNISVFSHIVRSAHSRKEVTISNEEDVSN